MAFIDRIGIDYGRRLPAERAVEHAAANGVRTIDCQLDVEPNALESFDAVRCAALRELAERHGVQIALHTLSAVNIAEISPFMRDSADRYLATYIEVAARTGAKWVVVHAGYHFTADRRQRMEVSLERLKRAVGEAERHGVRLLLENMNREPDRAEVHYLGHDLEECHFYFDAIASPHLGWSFTINHATLLPVGIAGFLAAMPADRLGEVRVADNNGEYELHMVPGEGIVDWPDMFARVEATGFSGPYTCAFGGLDDMLRARPVLSALAAQASVS